MKIVNSNNGALWYVLDSEGFILKVFHTQHECNMFVARNVK